MSENFVENHTSTEGAPSIGLCVKIGNNPANHPTHISLGSHIVCMYTAGSRCAPESVSDYSPTADKQMIPSALSRQNELPGLPACFEEKGVFFLPFFKMSISGVILNGWAAEDWCLTWGHGHTAITDPLLVGHKGSFFAGQPSSKYATAAVSLHGFFNVESKKKRWPLQVNSWH